MSTGTESVRKLEITHCLHEKNHGVMDSRTGKNTGRELNYIYDN